MGNVLIIAGIAGLVLTAIASPIAIAVLRRQAKELNRWLKQEDEWES